MCEHVAEERAVMFLEGNVSGDGVGGDWSFVLGMGELS